MKVTKISDFDIVKDLEIAGYDPLRIRTLKSIHITIILDKIPVSEFIPKGIESDFASIPTWVQPVIGEPSQKEFVLAAIVHDFFCATQQKKQDYTHNLFRELLKLAGVPFWKRQLMFLAVKVYCRKKYKEWK